MCATVNLEDLIAAAEPFRVCTQGWDRMGYGGNYTCLDREIDIDKTDHQTLDWWPHTGPCNGCKLARVLGYVGRGTENRQERLRRMAEDHDRREYERLSKKFGKAEGDGPN